MKIQNHKIQIQLFPCDKPDFDASDDWAVVASINIDGISFDIHHELTEGEWVFININNGWYKMTPDPFWDYLEPCSETFVLKSGDVEGQNL